MIKLGRDVTGFNIVHFISRSLDQILIGKYWGAGPLGLYRQAYY
jgi:PST family polysaccharide transporter